jgi:phosphoserine phosphatase RsbU/P
VTSQSPEKKISDLEQRLQELELQLEKERQYSEEKASLNEKTLAETEELARHLQNTTLALIQERQTALARAEKERLVNKWVERINSSFDLENVLYESVKEMGEYLKVDRCGIVLLENKQVLISEFVQSKRERDVSPEELSKNIYLRKTVKGKRNQSIENIPNQAQDGFMKDVKSFLSVPLMIRDEVAGVLYLQQCNRNREWNEREIDLIESTVIPLSTAIEKARLYKEAQERSKQAELLNSLTTQIRSSLDLDEILARTVTELGKALEVSRCFLFFDGYITEEYVAENIKPITNNLSELILDKLIDEPLLFKTIAVNNLLSDENINKLNEQETEKLLLSGAKSALATPLHFQGILKGWIVFHSCTDRIWTNEEVQFIESAASQVIVAMTQSRIYEKLNSYQEKLSRELKQAARVQTSLIGGDVFDVHLETSVFYKAHSNVSGDFYWVAELAPDIVGVLIGDVSGKGPAAALLTGYLLGEFNAAISNSALAWYPEKLISFLSQSILYQNMSSDFYATAWYGVFDLDAGKLKYTNAGHLNPYLILEQKEVSMLDEDKDAGVPLGLLDMKDLEETYEARTIDFKPGDKMLLITDGLLDQRMPSGEFVPKNWTLKGLEKLKDRPVKEITYELNERLNDLSGATALSDDRLMICIEQRKFEINEFNASDRSACLELIEKIIQECKKKELPEDRVLDLKLGLTEALSNSVRYGLDKNPYGTIRLGYIVSKGSFKLSLIDPGPGFNWQRYHYKLIDEVGFDEEGGRGIPLLKEIFDKVTWNHLGNHMGLFFYW